MNAPDRRHRPRTLREGETLVVIHPGDPRTFRRIAAKLLAHPPKPRKGLSIARDLAASRLRGG